MIKLTYKNAAEGVHIGVLKYLKKEGVSFARITSEVAGKGGDIYARKYLKSKGVAFDSGTCLVAAQRGHIDVLKYLKSEGMAYVLNTCIGLAQEQSIFLGQRRCAGALLLDVFTSVTLVTCIYCRNWSGSLGDFAWHLNQAHGIPAHVAKCILSKLVDQFEKSKSCSAHLGLGKLVHLNSNENVDATAETFQALKFLDAHYKCIPQSVFDHQQNLSDCE